MGETLLFAGPTLARAQAIAAVRTDGIRVVPPVRRGDVARAVATGAPGTLVIVDGIFHAGLSVGHRELREAIAAGWQVWGLSSMGAIRAREMRHLGMRGYGRVFEMFCGDGDFRDDEVALLHEPGPPWRELSEPLVHLRAALDVLVERGEIAGEAARAIAADLSDRWFGDRTVAVMCERLVTADVTRKAIDRLVDELDKVRIKALDLVEFLAVRPDRSPLPFVHAVEASSSA